MKALYILFFILLSCSTTKNVNFSKKTKYLLSQRIPVSKLDVSENDTLRIWIPYPIENDRQIVHSVNVSGLASWKTTTEKIHGNKMIYAEVPASSIEDISIDWVITRFPQNAGKRSDSPKDKQVYLQSNSLIPLNGQIARISKNVAKGIKDNDAKISKFYDHIYSTMKYDKSGDGWGQGDAIWACNAKRGNCTDFHSLFIGLNRAQGIPARFSIGFPTKKTNKETIIPGYHCWAEAYSEKQSWVPVDASNAKKAHLGRKFYGYLPSDRIEFTRGRDLTLTPKQSGKALNYFIYPYVEMGKKYQNLKAHTTFKIL